jgi:biopolymer transport protein ExbD
MKYGFELPDPWEEGIDLTSIIDVLFLLLTFFILAASFTAPSIEVVLAESENADQRLNHAEFLTFSIDSDGKIYFDKDEIGAAGIDAILEGKPPNTAIVFNVDKSAPFEAFMTVLDKVKSGGYTNYLINSKYKAE